MVLIDEKSKLCAHGFSFRNWPGPGAYIAYGYRNSEKMLTYSPKVRKPLQASASHTPSSFLQTCAQL